MKRKSLVGVLLAAVVAGSLMVTPGTATAGKKAAGPAVVGEDPVGDWGQNTDAALAPLGDVLGQDLVGASLADNGENVDFIIKVNALPATGGMPEISRYTWNFNVGKKAFDLDGKFTNFSRGACDPTAATCPPPRNPDLQPFVLRGNCGVTPIGTINFTTCEELALIKATFDAGAGTITIPVPKAAMGAKPGSKILPGVNIFGGSISAAPSAWGTFGNFPMDTMVVTKKFSLPK